MQSDHEDFVESTKGFFKETLSFGDAHEDNGQSLMNILEALHSLKTAVLAAKDYPVSFDGMLFLRPDLLYHDTLDFALVRRTMMNNAVTTPGWQLHRGYNDRFSYGAWDPMYAIGTRYDTILTYCQTTSRPFTSESFLQWSLENLHSSGQVAQLWHTSLRASRVRADGGVKAENFTLVRPVFDEDKSSFQIFF